MGALVVGAPTDHLANERTFLAWVRTAITIIGLGFVVAKFGIFLRELAGTTGATGTNTSVSEIVGVSLVLAGSALVVLAWHRFRLVQDHLKKGTYETHVGIEMVLMGILVAVGIALAGYLLITG